MSALERLERATWDTRATVQTDDVRWLLDRHTALVGMLKLIADDFHPETDREAVLALSEMREAINAAIANAEVVA